MDWVKGSLFVAIVLFSWCAQAQAPREAERDRDKKVTRTPQQAPLGAAESSQLLNELLATVKLQTEAITQLRAKVDQFENRLPQPATSIAVVSAIVSVLALVASYLTYSLNRRLQPLTPATKLLDRVYEIDKLILQYPEVMAAFLRESQRTEPYFFAPEEVVARDVMYIKLKAFTYYLLDFNEEIYLVLQDRAISGQVQGQVWLDFIIKRMRHPLLRELFCHEGEHTYRGKFADFIRSKSAEIDRPYDPDVW